MMFLVTVIDRFGESFVYLVPGKTAKEAIAQVHLKPGEHIGSAVEA
ncbi:MAG: hypothetical protein IJ737_06930 [Ruminococcus sp.]|nr:hypothetical protein [Ruminococcus sp.]